MKLHKLPWQLSSLLLVLALTACGGSGETPAPTLDIALIQTQAAQTVAAQFTQTAAAQPSATPSPTQEPPTVTVSVNVTATNIAPLGGGTLPAPAGAASPTLSLFPPLPTNTGVPCNDSLFIADVGVPDGSKVKVGTTFQKGWLIQNTGSCDWLVGYSLQRVGGNTNFDAVPYVINNFNQAVFAGQFGEIVLTLTAPKTPNTYEAHFQMFSDKNIPFGMMFTISLVVTR